jgi:hypothetical protein
MILFLTQSNVFVLKFIVKSKFWVFNSQLNFSLGNKHLMNKKRESAMKKIISTLCVISLSTFMLGGCTNTEVGTGVGGAAGAGLGYAVTGGSALGTVIGAGAGALVGNSIGQEQDRRAYYYHHRYYNNGYYY